MPACYAHYRFGCEMLEKLPEDTRGLISRFRRLYDVGLHGPDPFFYYMAGIPNPMYTLGSELHAQSGEAFFGRVCRTLRLQPEDGAEAYLYGVLTHYALDSCCHPFINTKAQEGPATHTQIEGELERYLLELDGKIPPEEQDVSVHICLTARECSTASRFYPGVSPRQMERAVRSMARCTRFLVIPKGRKRSFVRRGLAALAPSTGGLLIPTEPDPLCRDLDGQLMELYAQAQALFPRLAAELRSHLKRNTPLGPDFARPFG